MELPRRARGDELLKPGEMTSLRQRLRSLAPQHDLVTVIACAFDHRTRMLPFLYADLKMAPAGVRAIGSAMVDSGFHKTRIVLQQWNASFRPSQMALDGRMPDLFMVSSMSLHSAQCDALIRDACRLDPARRPLIIVGGPRIIYEPWRAFHADPADPWGADVAVTGEEYVLLNLLEVLLSVRARDEPLRSAFARARDSGALDDVPGLVYALPDQHGVPVELVDTGVQRLLGDLDELPHPVLGYQLLEPPSTLATLGPEALTGRAVRHNTRLASLVLTLGCQFRCPYCPIPAYNQRQFRGKSGERIADEIGRLYTEYGIAHVFGADDNFFAKQERALEIAEVLARQAAAGSRAHCKVHWATEATIHDTLRIQDHLPLLRSAGLQALWLGVEDMTGTLIKKGQTADRTLEAFALMRRNGIYPMPMMMHYDEQPLVTLRGGGGLLNQMGRLRGAGALYTQVLMLSPATGSKLYEGTYTSGMAFDSVDGVPVEPALGSGMHVIASRHPRPWLKQLNLMVGYAWFFNLPRLLWALVRSKSRIPRSDVCPWPPPGPDGRPARIPLKRRVRQKIRAHLYDAGFQAFGIWAVAKTLPSTLAWAWHLLRGGIVRSTAAPTSPIPMRSATGGAASHALPGTPLAEAPVSVAVPVVEPQPAPAD
ncbi:MAG: radical SAM protein [Armatimonadetes bacterium]|nr:radical SAM protein [Armatimonadota bacterium]